MELLCSFPDCGNNDWLWLKSKLVILLRSPWDWEAGGSGRRGVLAHNKNCRESKA